MREGVLCWPKNSLPSATSIGAAVRCRLFRLNRSTPPPKKADGVKWKYKKLACFSASGIIKKQPVSPPIKENVTGKQAVLFVEKQAVFFMLVFTPSAFLGGGAKRPACQWQERPLGRRAPRESPETSGGSGSEPTRRLRLRKGRPSLPQKNLLPHNSSYSSPPAAASQPK